MSARLSVVATILAAILLGFGASAPARAQPYPTRPVTMIVPFPAGGATDTLARFLGEHMRPVLGQPIVIENVGGAAGTLGVGRAVRSPADGYTLSDRHLHHAHADRRRSTPAVRSARMISSRSS